MKNLLILLFFIPVISWGQSEPFKGANTLVVMTDQDNVFSEAGKKLVQDGWEITDSNADFGTITTGWKEVGYIKQRMIVAVLDGKIQIQGKLMNEGVNSVFNTTGSDFDLEWKKGGVQREAWERMESFANYFGTKKKYFKK